MEPMRQVRTANRRFYIVFPFTFLIGFFLSLQCRGNTLVYWVTFHLYGSCNIVRLLLLVSVVKGLGR